MTLVPLTTEVVPVNSTTPDMAEAATLASPLPSPVVVVPMTQETPDTVEAPTILVPHVVMPATAVTLVAASHQ